MKHAAPVALLTYPFWKRQFGGDTGIVGRTIDLSNTSVTVIGVLPNTFDFGSVFSPGAKVDLFVPYIMDDFRDDGNDLALVGRLKKGVTLTQAQNDANQIFPQLLFEHKHPEYKAGYTGQLIRLKDYVSGKLRRSLIVLWCAVGLILLIVCVNLSNFGPEGAFLVLRSRLPPAALARSVMLSLRRIDPGQPATEFKPIQALVDHSTSPRRFFVLLVGIFAGLGLLLASLGIYGVISYSVVRQRPEIGVRMALGATETRVQLEVIWRTMQLALAGVSVGIIASLAVSRLIAFLLFKTAPRDPLTFIGIIVLLGAVALLAGYLPARKASKIDPMIALRAN